ncbi:unnamed protein product, partial [Pylaiella littoralis]
MRNHAGSRDVGVVHAGQDVDRGQHIPAEVNPGGGGRAEALSEGSISDVQADHVHKNNRERRSFHRRVLMMSTVVVKAILGAQYLASHDIKRGSMSEGKGYLSRSYRLFAEHGLWATTSRVDHRESFHATIVKDENLLPKNATCAAIPYDNCDFDPRIGGRQGEGPHISTIAASAVTVGPEVGR